MEIENCAYCERVGNKDGQIPVIDKDVPFGALGKGMLSLYINNRKTSREYGMLELRINMNGAWTKDIIASAQIAYCPMCGRKLEAPKDRVIQYD